MSDEKISLTMIEIAARGSDCQSCRFWWEEDGCEEGSVQMGECRIRSPIAFRGQYEYIAREFLSVGGNGPVESEGASVGIWPVTRCWDSCGDWKPLQAIVPRTRMMDGCNADRTEEISH